ncbi:MAG: OmpA family protein [Pseudomonadota bacterium]
MQKTNRIAVGLALSAMVLAANPGVADTIPHPAEPPEKGKRIAEGAGVGGGMLVGGLVGGPIGMMVGAGLGTWLGSRVVEASRAEEAQEQLASTERTLEETRQSLDRAYAQNRDLELDLADRTDSLAQLQALNASAQQANQELRSALASGLEMQVMFRTGASDLTSASAEQVTSLAGVLADVDGLIVQLDGYADPRGDERYNETLTAARVASVEKALRAGGLRESQLEGFAHGERAYAFEEGDYDAYALERRVDITLLAVEESATAGSVEAGGEEASVDLVLLGER